ncbi:MAG: hypothetical protein WCS92_02970 [Candidatus Babeliales bacterium]|jgi:hypothetical protein|nr:MAG: hypothetical protein US22_C0019G0008 [candidate division TM6 bacterium GW2011_GWF2_36_6]
MKKSKKIVFATVLLLVCKFVTVAAFRFALTAKPVPTVKTVQDVLGNWVLSQRCYSDYSFDNMPDGMNEFFLQRFNKSYLKYRDKLTSLVPFLSDCTNGYISEDGQITGSEIDDDFRQNFSTIYQLIENNMPRFVSYLKDHKFDFSAENNGKDQDLDVNFVINKYRSLDRLFFSNPSKFVEKERLFSFSNRCFEYCFNSLTWPDFKKYLDNNSDHQLVKFLYSTMWYHLVGEGWKDWNNQTLVQIAEKSKQGARVVYIAGGLDIYQLLKYGIYNIDIIDPLLPSLEKYYSSKNWEWLIKGNNKNNGLEDKITFDFDGRKISLVRKKYSKNGVFVAHLSAKEKRKIEKSVTDWMVFDENNKYLGSVTFYRRFCDHADFITHSIDKKSADQKKEERLILMSFNELYYAFLPKEASGWDINIKHLPEDVKIYVKQLRNPIDVDVLKNIAQAEESKFKFIRLGSDPA